jgi:hypothetical protein
MNTIRSQKELMIGTAFLSASPLADSVQRIESRNPPEPDLLCTTLLGERIGFELTELIDESFMSRNSRMVHMNQYLNKFWRESLSLDENMRFQERFSDANILVSFNDDVKMNDRKKLCAPLFSFLIQLQKNFSGRCEKISSMTPELKGVNNILVQRVKSKGPNVQTNSFGFLSDPTYDAISKKLKKTYAVTYPVHLLAHIEFDLLHASSSFAELVSELRAVNPAAQIVKVWIFNSVLGRIVFEES